MFKHYLLLVFSVALFLVFSCEKDENPDVDPNQNPTDTLSTDTLSTDTLSTDTLSTDTLGTDTLDTDTIQEPEMLPCNGDTSLCGKRYNEMVFAITHNAHADTGDFSPFAANQNHTIADQLENGIRAINIKAYYTDDESCGDLGMYVYHGFPLLGCVPLSKSMNEVAAFMESNPREVITMAFEGSVTPEQLFPELDAAGISQYLYDHTFGAPWPTMGELLDSGKRLVVLVGAGSDQDYEGIMPLWEFRQDNEYAYETPEQMVECVPVRGNFDSDLFQINNFLTNITPQPEGTHVVNEYEFLKARVQNCINETGLYPTYVMIDFYEFGDVLRVVDELNGL